MPTKKPKSKNANAANRQKKLVAKKKVQASKKNNAKKTKLAKKNAKGKAKLANKNAKGAKVAKKAEKKTGSTAKDKSKKAALETKKKLEKNKEKLADKKKLDQAKQKKLQRGVKMLTKKVAHEKVQAKQNEFMKSLGGVSASQQQPKKAGNCGEAKIEVVQMPAFEPKIPSIPRPTFKQAEPINFGGANALSQIELSALF